MRVLGLAGLIRRGLGQGGVQCKLVPSLPVMMFFHVQPLSMAETSLLQEHHSFCLGVKKTCLTACTCKTACTQAL